MIFLHWIFGRFFQWRRNWLYLGLNCYTIFYNLMNKRLFQRQLQFLRWQLRIHLSIWCRVIFLHWFHFLQTKQKIYLNIDCNLINDLWGYLQKWGNNLLKSVESVIMLIEWLGIWEGSYFVISLFNVFREVALETSLFSQVQFGSEKNEVFGMWATIQWKLRFKMFSQYV